MNIVNFNLYNEEYKISGSNEKNKTFKKFRCKWKSGNIRNN